MRVAVLVSVVLLLGVAGCTSAEQVAPTPSPAATTTPESGVTEPSPVATSPPAATASPTPTDGTQATQEPAGTTEVTVFYVRSAPDGLWVEPEVRRLAEPTVAVARAAMEELFEGDPVEPGLSRPVEGPVEVLDANLTDGLLTIDVSSALAEQSGGSASEQALRQAIAHTGTAFETVDRVQLLVDGDRVTDLWGHLDWSEPFAADPFALSPIDIIEPAPRSSQPPGPVTAAGTANTFEATVPLRLVDPDGDVVEETFTTATCGSGCRGTWQHTFDTEATTPGTWAIEAVEPDPSGGEGGPPFSTRREFDVSG